MTYLCICHPRLTALQAHDELVLPNSWLGLPVCTGQEGVASFSAVLLRGGAIEVSPSPFLFTDDFASNFIKRLGNNQMKLISTSFLFDAWKLMCHHSYLYLVSLDVSHLLCLPPRPCCMSHKPFLALFLIFYLWVNTASFTLAAKRSQCFLVLHSSYLILDPWSSPWGFPSPYLVFNAVDPLPSLKEPLAYVKAVLLFSCCLCAFYLLSELLSLCPPLTCGV